MKYLFCLVIFLLTGWCAIAQETVLKGTLGFAGGESFTYELHLTEEANGTLRGYSLLYATPGNETRATVIGLVNREEKTLSFSEQSIDYSRNFESRAYICRLSASLTFHPYASAGRPGLFGSAGANEYNDYRCSPGTLSFNASDALRKFFAESPRKAAAGASGAPIWEKPREQLPLPLPQPAPVAAPIPVATIIDAKPVQPVPPASSVQLSPPRQEVQKMQPVAPLDPPLAAATPPPSIENMPANQQPSPRRFYFFEKENKEEIKAAPQPPKPKDTTGGLHLTEHESADITVSSDVLEISVFDGSGNIDGDQINLLYNDRPLLNRFTLRAAPQIVRLPVAKGGKLRIAAVGAGTEKTCRVHVHIRDGSRLHRFVIINTVGKEADIQINREGQPQG